MATHPETAADPVLEELSAIKRLLICALRRSGASQEDVAIALGINQSNVSRMLKSVGARKPKKSKRRPT
jgi:predicted transcriptional regulator